MPFSKIKSLEVKSNVDDDEVSAWLEVEAPIIGCEYFLKLKLMYLLSLSLGKKREYLGSYDFNDGE